MKFRRPVLIVLTVFTMLAALLATPVKIGLKHQVGFPIKIL